MEWYTTKEAAEQLKITTARVRQLIRRHAKNKNYVLLKEPKNSRPYYIVSDGFINEVGKNGKEYRQQILKAGERIEQPDGTIVEAFSYETYKKFEDLAANFDKIKKFEKLKKELQEIESRFKQHIEDLRNQIEDLKEQRNSYFLALKEEQSQNKALLQVVSQRNLIEAKEKKVS